ERDPALTRRFQVVKIEEPSEEKAINMMRAISEMLQNHHGVRIMDEAIVDSVRLSSRYITARQLPDKSVSLLDTACARVALSQSATPAAIEDTRRQITQCETTIQSLGRENASLGNCEERIAQLIAEKESLQTQLKKEAEKVKEIQALQKQIEDDFHARNLSTEEAADSKAPKALTDNDLAKVKQSLHRLREELAQLQGETPMIQVNVNSQAIAEVVA